MQSMLLQPSKIRYHRACDYRVLTEALGELAVRHPVLELSSVGTSVLDRPIPIITIGRDPHSRSVLFVGGIHPTDVLTPAMLLRFVSEYAEALENGRRLYNLSLPYLYENRTIRVVPMLNPDGYEIRRHGAADDVVRERLLKQNGSGDFKNWRGNARGVDLWRNFTECPEVITDDEMICPQGTAGLSPESEPETAALCNYLRIMDGITAVLSFHTLGNRLRCFSSDHAPTRSRTLARLLSRMTGCPYEPMPQTAAESGGSLTDWFICEYDRPAFEFGCLTDESVDPANPENCHAVYAAFREALFSAPLMI